jgi:hypothetical protein
MERRSCSGVRRSRPRGLYTGNAFQGWKGNIFVGAMRGTLLQRIVLNAKGCRRSANRC